MAGLVWHIEATTDLDDIAEYIARRSPDYAPHVVQRIVGATEHLTRFPEMGRVVPELDDPTLREVIFQNYRVVYLTLPDVVVILGVIHGAMDLRGVAEDRSWILP